MTLRKSVSKTQTCDKRQERERKGEKEREIELRKRDTVKLGYNELGYNEHSVITNEYFGPK